MQTSYSFLRNFAGLLKWTGIILSMLSVLLLLFLISAIKDTDFSFYSILVYLKPISYFIGGILSIFISSALITLLCDMADYSRMTVHAIKEQSELLKGKTIEPVQSQNTQHNKYMPQGFDKSINDTFAQ